MMPVFVLRERAKRLRTAVTTMFDVPVSVAQSLELVAQEEGFSTRAAASVGHEREATDLHRQSLEYGGVTASEFLPGHSQHGLFLVAPPGYRQQAYVRQTVLDQLRTGKTVVALDLSRDYHPFTELSGGTYHQLQADGEHESRCFGGTPLVVYDLDKMLIAGQAAWHDPLPFLPPDLHTAKGFLLINAAGTFASKFPGAIALLESVAAAGGSYCVVGQRDEDVRGFTVAAVPFTTTVHLHFGPP